jgi:hypothetical protein
MSDLTTTEIKTITHRFRGKLFEDCTKEELIEALNQAMDEIKANEIKAKTSYRRATSYHERFAEHPDVPMGQFINPATLPTPQMDILRRND